MYLSFLQQHILISCFVEGGKVERSVFHQFYSKRVKKSSEKYQEGIITKSLERLIDKELLVGYGRRTPHKWFITHVRLTKKGYKMGQCLLEEKQIKLPLR